MTPEQKAELKILRCANENGKFAILLSEHLSESTQSALERLQIRRWMSLIDVTRIHFDTEHFYRIFLLSDEAQKWTNEMLKESGEKI